MVTAAGDALTYDAMGNLVAHGNDSLPGGVREEYRYDENARLTTAIRHGSTIASYGHNPMGQRIRRTVNSDSVWSLYDLQGNWLGEYDSAGMPRQQVIWFAGMPVGVIDRRREGAAQEGARLFYVQTDALGTPRAVIDPVSEAHPWGKAVWRWELEGDAFGGDLPIDDPDNDGKRFTFDMRFPGQRYDDATGLHYNYFRDYDPAVGRYVQSDPIGLAGGVSTYAYVASAPATRSDRYGLYSSSIDGAGDATSCATCAPQKRRFGSTTDAAKFIIGQVASDSYRLDREFCGLICRDNESGQYFLAGVTTGTSTSCAPGAKPCPSCSSQAAWWHTHGKPFLGGFLGAGASDEFSDEDLGISNQARLQGYLGTPYGFVRRYDPISGVISDLGRP